MQFTQNILIGNVISMVAALFTIASAVCSGRKKIFYVQAAQCALMALASFFFFSFSAIPTFILCAVRNVFTAEDKLTGKLCILFMILTVVLGLAANNRGLLGLLPIVATVIYTAGSYAFKDDFRIKGNIALNLTLWGIYDIFVLDIVSLVVDTVSVAAAVISMVRESLHKRRLHGQEDGL